MGKIIQFHEILDCDRLPDEYKDALGKYRFEAMRKAEEINKNPKAYTREERMRMILDLEYAQLAHEKGWNDEEFSANREAFDREKTEESKKADEWTDKELDMIYNDGKNLTEFEKKQTEKHMKDNPEDEKIITGFINMISAGINDPEHITDYSD
ncbi:MAG: hypothetical protein K5675_10705 [Lachnospiraceae bacterium]|nr:hypothetical protein [Lachnospiraceae bacterium]